MQFVDELILDLDKALRVVGGAVAESRPNPANVIAEVALSEAEKRHSAGLMRINHVGEVCAQALYDAQGRFAQSDALKRQFAHAGIEEEDHLAWTAARLRELGSHTSLLNPLWYAGSYVLGTIAAFELPNAPGGYLASRGQTVARLCREAGVLVRPLGDTLYVVPPFSIRESQLIRVYDALSDSMENL